MKYKVKPFEAIKNIQRAVLAGDFRLSPLSLLVLAVFLAAGLAWQLLTAGAAAAQIVQVALAVMAGGVLVLALSFWGVVMAIAALLWILLLAGFGPAFVPLFLPASLGLLLAPAFQIAHHWEKAVILRLGRFRKLRGPGVFVVMPLIDRVARYVDTRIRATDFSAEKTITMDTVPVHVDALAFWMIWDPRKAILEVENYLEAVVLSAQTALRDAIGRHELSDLLSERERLGREIQQALDRKTNPWGISILSIEITDIIIPKELENAMSKRAQAERERQSRVILGTAEVEISEKFVEAARRYRDNPTALHLRAMNMIYEGIKQHGTIVLLPSGALSTMNLGSMLDELAQGKALGSILSAAEGATREQGAAGPQSVQQTEDERSERRGDEE